MHKTILEKINNNIKKGIYKALPLEESAIIRQYYASQIPCHIPLNGGNITLCTYKNTILSHKYDRIVIGDYGAYFEIAREDILTENLIVPKKQEYRLEPKYKDTVKYFWFTANDDSDIKIYYQKRTVNYADYKVGYCYIDPKEVYIR